VIVLKFGGTSVQDAEAIDRVAGIVRGRMPGRPLVVVSAMAGATNALLAIGEQASKGHLVGAVRGAAGAAVLNAELLVAQGRVDAAGIRER
jgi:aspartate kinase